MSCCLKELCCRDVTFFRLIASGADKEISAVHVLLRENEISGSVPRRSFSMVADMATEKYRPPLLEVEKVLPILNRISLFGALDDTQLYTVFRMLETEQYRKGEFVFRQGDAPDHIRIIEKGRIRLVENVDGTPMELFEFGPGDCFGETSVLAIHPHTADALALEDTDLLVVPREKLFALYERDPKLFGMLMMNIAREASRRLNRTEEVMLHYALGRK
ncbi:cyclic nucleotide-binding domain-containing protein [Verrucomicrobia bacterium S94]|nr:cyclic nucleotide-binding domain-containing protein [Verrucomicrobia bacterium S94]